MEGSSVPLGPPVTGPPPWIAEEEGEGEDIASMTYGEPFSTSSHAMLTNAANSLGGGPTPFSPFASPPPFFASSPSSSSTPLSATSSSPSPLIHLFEASRAKIYLRGYHLARQLRLVTAFERTVLYGAMEQPLFHFCLSPAVQQAAEEQRRAIVACVAHYLPLPTPPVLPTVPSMYGTRTSASPAVVLSSEESAIPTETAPLTVLSASSTADPSAGEGATSPEEPCPPTTVDDQVTPPAMEDEGLASPPMRRTSESAWSGEGTVTSSTMTRPTATPQEEAHTSMEEHGVALQSSPPPAPAVAAAATTSITTTDTSADDMAARTTTAPTSSNSSPDLIPPTTIPDETEEERVRQQLEQEVLKWKAAQHRYYEQQEAVYADRRILVHRIMSFLCYPSLQQPSASSASPEETSCGAESSRPSFASPPASSSSALASFSSPLPEEEKVAPLSRRGSTMEERDTTAEPATRTAESADGGTTTILLPHGKEEGGEPVSHVAPLMTASPAKEEPEGEMLFYVAPPSIESHFPQLPSFPTEELLTSASGGVFTTGGFGGGPHKTKQVFIRIAKDMLMNDESLNPYFGRYGQVSCHRGRVVGLLESGYTPVVIHLLATSFDCHPSQILLQDFIVNVDSVFNALTAVHRAYFKELLFIALSDPEYNCYHTRDVDAVIQEVLPYRWPPFPLPFLPSREEGKDEKEDEEEEKGSISEEGEEEEGKRKKGKGKAHRKTTSRGHHVSSKRRGMEEKKRADKRGQKSKSGEKKAKKKREEREYASHTRPTKPKKKKDQEKLKGKKRSRPLSRRGKTPPASRRHRFHEVYDARGTPQVTSQWRGREGSLSSSSSGSSSGSSMLTSESTTSSSEPTRGGRSRSSSSTSSGSSLFSSSSSTSSISSSSSSSWNSQDSVTFAMKEGELRASVAEPGKGYVPDIVVHGFPYWWTQEMIRQFFLEHGFTVPFFRVSMDDRTGVFTGAVLLRMPTAMEALQLSEKIHGVQLSTVTDTLAKPAARKEEEEGGGGGGGEEQYTTLVSGVVTPSFEIVSLWTGEVRMGAVKQKEKGEEEDVSVKGTIYKKSTAVALRNITMNERLWI